MTYVFLVVLVTIAAKTRNYCETNTCTELALQQLIF